MCSLEEVLTYLPTLGYLGTSSIYTSTLLGFNLLSTVPCVPKYVSEENISWVGMS